MASIKYSELNVDRHEIRLLTIFPCHVKEGESPLGDPLDSFEVAISATYGQTVEDTSPICCSLQTISLDNAHPNFMALSYRWRTGSPHLIQVDETPVEIGENLERALRHIRQPSRPVTIWVDSICINQADNREKSTQVQMMGQIYTEATVLAWLGEGDDSTDEVMAALDDAGRRAISTGIMGLRWSYLSAFRSPNPPPHLVTIRDAVREEGNQVHPAFPHLGWKALSERDYWNRVWMIQELSLPRDMLFLCGTKTLAARRWEAAIVFLGQIRSNFHMSLSPKDRIDETRFPQLQRPNGAVSSMVGSRRRSQGETGDPQTLMILLMRMFMDPDQGLQVKCTDPRDMIYGLMGMASDRETLQALGIKISYDKTEKEVYAEMAKALIRQDHLRILAWCQHPESFPDWPSWVPRFDTLLRPAYGEDKFFVRFYSASGSQTQESVRSAALSEDPKLLSLVCVKVDVIENIGRTLVGDKDNDLVMSAAKIFCEEIESFCTVRDGRLQTEFETGQQRPVSQREAATPSSSSSNASGTRWRVPVADLTPRNFKRSRAFDSAILKQGYDRFRVYFAGGGKLYDNPDNILDTPAFAYSMGMQFQIGRRPFLSQSGYVGLAPKTAAPGDEIYVVVGADVPFVFRKLPSGRHRLIGEAYVDGIMDGQLMDEPHLTTLHIV